MEVKKLYIDEYIEYSNSLIYIKEKRGEMEKGTYNKIKGKKADTVGNLKAQLFNIKSNGKQKSSR